MGKRFRDSQRSKLYAWEDAAMPHEGSPLMTIEECQALVNKVWRKYKFATGECPTVQAPKRRRGNGCYRPHLNVIILPKWTRMSWYVLHETAHAIGARGEYHGPNFCRTYADLLCKFDGWTAVISNMRAFGLKVAR